MAIGASTVVRAIDDRSFPPRFAGDRMEPPPRWPADSDRAGKWDHRLPRCAVGAYDEGATIVIQAPIAGTGADFDFGIRLSKAPTMATSFASVAPSYWVALWRVPRLAGRVASDAY